MEEVLERGVSSLWNTVNHVAIVVSDVGRSLSFYTDIIGMKQVQRPNFDRHGAWLTFGNLDLHLIKGRPAVHEDDDLIVGHIAITVTNMPELRKKLELLDVKSRKNISVPNPADSDTGTVDQAFVRDPDGYYIEFCNCEKLEKYLHSKMADEAKRWNLSTSFSVLSVSNRLKQIANGSRELVRQASLEQPEDESVLELIAWPDLSEVRLDGTEITIPDETKLANLIKRRKVYGDITQNATEEELSKLLIYFDNDVPKVIAALEGRVRSKGTRTFVPPAFYGRDGLLVQPPNFEMPILDKKKSNDFSIESPRSVRKISLGRS